MTNSKELFNDLKNRVRLDETVDEIQSLIYLLLEHQLGLTRTDILRGQPVEITDSEKWDEIISRINRHEPIQYILGEADFYGRKFMVDPSVLIPRPETELIVDEVIRSLNFQPPSTGTFVDMGTGSGCLAVTLAKELPGIHMVATDISEKALEVAMANAHHHGVLIQFLCHDMLTNSLPLNKVDVLVSNPPYITFREKSQLKDNVLRHEPAIALYVTDEDPLMYYKALASHAGKLLTPTGKVWVEVNERFGQDVATLFIHQGFQHVSVQRDLNGKDRIVSAAR